MIARHLTPALRRAAEQYPVVTLTGPRQSGKTTLVRAVFPEHRLAGRTALLLLPPFSLAELHGLPPLDPWALDRQEAPESAAERLAGLDLWETLVTGFYPPVHDRGLSPGEWMSDYFRTYVERDLRDVSQVLDLRAFEDFVRLAAGRTATELNLSGLAGDAGVTHQTARRWLTALEIGYIATTLPPHHANYRKRLRKRPRLHLLDSGMVCYLLGIEDARTTGAGTYRADSGRGFRRGNGGYSAC